MLESEMYIVVVNPGDNDKEMIVGPFPGYYEAEQFTDKLDHKNIDWALDVMYTTSEYWSDSDE
jgi:hypothetical protein